MIIEIYRVRIDINGYIDKYVLLDTSIFMDINEKFHSLIFLSLKLKIHDLVM